MLHYKCHESRVDHMTWGGSWNFVSSRVFIYKYHVHVHVHVQGGINRKYHLVGYQVVAYRLVVLRPVG